MAKELAELYWIGELLPSNIVRKSMFGGFAYYLDTKLVLLLFESTGSKKYKNQAYDFELWNGCMFPAEKENHAKIKNKFSFLINHPILPKWLYLPLETENFEDNVRKVLREIRKQSPLFGTTPKAKQKKMKSSPNVKLNLKRPRMFSDEESSEEKIKEAKNLSDLKNFGPATEKTLHKAGIKSVKQFVKLGWKKSLVKLVQSNPKIRHSIFT
ncbi:MAG: TfoX/Sxy family DNA transformation protein, partial [Pseudobdellovibrio sp.]